MQVISLLGKTMYHRGKASNGYANQRTRTQHGKGLSAGHQSESVQVSVNSVQNKLYEALKLKPAGDWSTDLLKSTNGKRLSEDHWENVRKELEKAGTPKNREEFENTVKTAILTPQQRFIVLYETSLKVLLAPKAFTEYITLFKEVLPNHFKAIYGSKTPKQVTANCMKGNKKMF